MNWLPIERRPRDGSRVLLTNGRRIVVAQFERGCYYHLWTDEADQQCSPSEFAARIAEAKALADHCEPHTPESLAEYNSLRAAEMARYEAKRQQPHPQTDLPLEAA